MASDWLIANLGTVKVYNRAHFYCAITGYSPRFDRSIIFGSYGVAVQLAKRCRRNELTVRSWENTVPKQGNGDMISGEVAENKALSAVLKDMQVGTL